MPLYLKFYAYSKDTFASKLEVYGSSCTYTNSLPIWHMIEAQDVSINFGVTLPPSFCRKPDSPKSRPRSNSEVKDATPKKQKQCNCKHSRCLKL